MENENKFISSIDDAGSVKETENGQYAYSTTNNPLLDLFGVIGAMRERSDADIESMIAAAYSVDRLHTLKSIFYARDIRGGLGERRTFRIALRWLAKLHPADAKINFPVIATYGRWDDFYEFAGTALEGDAFDFMKDQFEADIANAKAGKQTSLLGKWLKSCNTTSEESRKLGRLTAKHFGLSEKDYRKSLSFLRKHLDVVERHMSANEWGIDYETVPSKAMANYRAAFERHDHDGFAEYVKQLQKGEAKINSSTLYPYDLVERYANGSHYLSVGNINDIDEIVEAQWKALPNYIDRPGNFVVMADVSGSMYGRPICSSLGLAIYFAQRNKGEFKNRFMTFTSDPQWVRTTGQSLHDDLAKALKGPVGYDTNIEKAFQLVLDTCVANKVPAEDLPKAIIAITDMEIDDATRTDGDPLDFTTDMARRFAAAGYEMPTIVWWNVNARNDTYHSRSTNRYARYVSGSSASSFGQLVAGLSDSAEALMLKVLDGERYAPVRVAE